MKSLVELPADPCPDTQALGPGTPTSRTQTEASRHTTNAGSAPEDRNQENMDKGSPLTSRTPPLCPSAQPDMPNSMLFGVVVGTPEQRRVGYLTQPKPVGREVLALAGPAKPTEVFRLAATCVDHGCKHFDGTDCTLAKRIVQFLPTAVSGLPPCKIRASCRWWRQEGKAACLRCPLVVTDIPAAPIETEPAESQQADEPSG